MIVKTETGSTYEFEDGRVRRVEFTHELRRDGEWLRLHPLVYLDPVVGESMTLILEPLGDGEATVRMTSRVTGVIW